MTYYILDSDHNVVPVSDVVQWAEFFRNGDRRVRRDELGGGEVVVSTVFLGLDHDFGVARPLIFETMIFGGPFSEHQWRYSTWAEAEARHAEILEQVRAVEARPGRRLAVWLRRVLRFWLTKGQKS